MLNKSSHKIAITEMSKEGETEQIRKMILKIQQNKKKITAQPDAEFVTKLEQQLLQELELMHPAKQKIAFDWNVLFQAFSPLTYPLLALLLVTGIYYTFSDKSNIWSQQELFVNDLVSYENSLLEIEEEIEILSDMYYLSTNVDFLIDI